MTTRRRRQPKSAGVVGDARERSGCCIVQPSLKNKPDVAVSLLGIAQCGTTDSIHCNLGEGIPLMMTDAVAGINDGISRRATFGLNAG